MNLCRLLQIESFRLYNKLHPELKFSQLEFLRSLVKQYMQNHRATLATLDVASHIVEMGKKWLSFNVNFSRLLEIFSEKHY